VEFDLYQQELISLKRGAQKKMEIIHEVQKNLSFRDAHVEKIQNSISLQLKEHAELKEQESTLKSKTRGFFVDLCVPFLEDFTLVLKKLQSLTTRLRESESAGIVEQLKLDLPLEIPGKSDSNVSVDDDLDDDSLEDVGKSHLCEPFLEKVLEWAKSLLLKAEEYAADVTEDTVNAFNSTCVPILDNFIESLEQVLTSVSNLKSVGDSLAVSSIYANLPWIAGKKKEPGQQKHICDPSLEKISQWASALQSRAIQYGYKDPVELVKLSNGIIESKVKI
jgi:hypothetical protein